MSDTVTPQRLPTPPAGGTVSLAWGSTLSMAARGMAQPTLPTNVQTQEAALLGLIP